MLTAPQPVDVHPCADGPAGRISSVPFRRVKARRPFPIHQGRNALPQQIEHLQAHMGSGGYLIGYDGGRIERIGVVLSEGEALRQRRPGRSGWQRQGEMAGFVGGGADGLVQVGQVKQPHLRVGDRLSRLQPHLAFKQGLRADADTHKQADEKAHKALHRKFLP